MPNIILSGGCFSNMRELNLAHGGQPLGDNGSILLIILTAASFLHLSLAPKFPWPVIILFIGVSSQGCPVPGSFQGQVQPSQAGVSVLQSQPHFVQSIWYCSHTGPYVPLPGVSFPSHSYTRSGSPSHLFRITTEVVLSWSG